VAHHGVKLPSHRVVLAPGNSTATAMPRARLRAKVCDAYAQLRQ
jgi:hypothetical protein